MAHSRSQSLYGFICAILILLFASGLYLAHINQISFWEDESWMAVADRGDLAQVWSFTAEHSVHPPLYFYIGWFTTRLTGESEVALRWLAGLCGVIGIAFTYRLGASWFGWRAGAYAALLAAGSLFLIYFGRLARQYTLFFALAAALVWVYTHKRSAFSHQPSAVSKNAGDHAPYSALSTQDLALIALLQTALLYTHYFGAWMALVIGLHGVLTLPRRDALRLLGALAVSGILFLPWLPSVIEQISGSNGGLGYVNPDIGLNLRAYIDRVFNGDYLLGFALVGVGIFALWTNRRFAAARPIALLLVLWLTLPLALSLLINTRFAWFIERNMIFTLAGAYALLGAGLAWVSQYRWGKIIAPLAALVFVVLGLARYDTFWPFITPDWRDLAQAVAPDARPEDTFVLNGEPYSMTYYMQRQMGISPPLVPLKNWLANPTSAKRIWLIDANFAVQDAARKALPADALMTRQVVLGVLVAELYQRAPGAPLSAFGGQIALGLHEPLKLQASAGTTLQLDLWWRAVRPPDTDYSVGLYLIDADGNILAQQDGGFDGGRVPAYALPLDRWTPDSRTLLIPAGLAAGDYRLTTAVYDWRDQRRLKPENGLENDSFVVGTVTILKE